MISTLHVPLDRLNECPGLNLVEIGQVRAQHDLVAPQQVNAALDALGGYRARHALLRASGTTCESPVGLSQYFAQSSISRRRFSKRSPRR